MPCAVCAYLGSGLLSAGAQKAGYSTDLWTLRRVAEQIQKHFGVHYGLGGARYILLEQLEWSWQKPERRVIQRDEQAIAHWKRAVWPKIRKARKLGAHLDLLEESEFMLMPNVRKTWTPVGQTTILRHSYRHNKLSVISSFTVSPRRQ